MSNLGQWALIDIETTGINPLDDSIIDIGFLQFDGIKLVKTYSSLVHTEIKLSEFIKKLTGITQSQVKNAPKWSEVSTEVLELMGHSLVAHNSDFEDSFLSDDFKKIDDGIDPRETYEDSLFFLPLLFPYLESYKLENFITRWQLADKEMHRGYEDSLDLLKVLLIAVSAVQKDKELFQNLVVIFNKYQLQEYWFYKFLVQDRNDLSEIAKQIDFDLDHFVAIAIEVEGKELFEEFKGSDLSFDREFSGKNIQNIFRGETEIQTNFSNYKYRKTQEDMALRVGQSFKNKVHALIQAPTGTGKTFGYMLPSSLFGYNEKKQVLVSTGTKTLQHQIMAKDVVQLRNLMNFDSSELKIAHLIGSKNHLCELLYREEQREEDLLMTAESFNDKFGALFLDIVFLYNSRSSRDKFINRDMIPYVLKIKNPKLKELTDNSAVDFKACTGKKCPFQSNCSYVQSLNKAKEADIIVGNHALMFTWPKSFSRPEYIIVDEAHKVESEATSSYSLEATKQDFENLLSALQSLQGVGSLFYLLAQNETEEGQSTGVINQIRDETLNIYSMIMDNYRDLDDDVEIYFKKMPRYTDIYWNELPMVSKESTNSLARSIFNRLDSIKNILQGYYDYLLPYSSRFEAQNIDDENQIIAITRFEKFYDSINELLECLIAIIDQRTNYSYSMKYHNDYGLVVNCSPIDIGKIVHDTLLQTTASVVFTSATLGNHNGDFGSKGVEWATGYSYLSPERRFKAGMYLPAVYDYKNKTKVFLCDDVAPMYDTNFVPGVLIHIKKLIRDIGGKSLLLFSSKVRFEIAREILLAEFEGNLPLFIQGMGQNIVEEFKKEGNGILLGMESFGEGIDIPGNALQFVFIDKIPDMRMAKVYQDRRDFYQANLGNEFTDYYLSHRTRSLHQKLGRLLRTETDRGGVIIVDSRTKKWKGRTMDTLSQLMLPYDIQRSSLDNACKEVVNFLEGDTDYKKEIEEIQVQI